MVGNAVAPIALAFAVLRVSGSGGALGLVLAARTVPQVVFLLFGGVIADRVPRRGILVVAAAGAGVTQAVAAGLLLGGVAQVWQLGVLEAMNGTAAAMLFPATQSVLPQTVPVSALQRANVVFRLGRNSTQVLGAAVGGLAVAAFGPGQAIAFDAATFFLAAALWSGMRLAPVRAGGAPPSMVRDLVEGWHDFWSRTWLWSIVVQFCFVNAATGAAFQVLGPIVAKQRLGGAGPWGLIVAANAAGLTLGALVMFWLRARRPLLAGNTGVLLVLPSLALLAYGAPVGWLIAAAVLAGLGMEVFGVNWDLTMQREIPPDRLGRLFSYDAVGSFVFLPVGQALAGPAMAAFGLSGALLVAGGVVAAATLAIYAVRDVRTLRVATAAA
jgi:MFS family permease